MTVCLMEGLLNQHRVIANLISMYRLGSGNIPRRVRKEETCIGKVRLAIILC